MGKLFLIALRNILQQRRRSLILGGAIALVSLLLVMMVGISNGMQEAMLKSATTLFSGHVNVAGFYKVSASDAAPLIAKPGKLQTMIREEIPEVDFVISRARGFGKIISDTSSQWSSISGVNIEDEKGFDEVLKIAEGDLQGLTEPNTVLIFEKHAERLEVKVGDVLTISAPTFRGVNNTVSVRVVAIAEDMGFMSSFAMFVPTETVNELYQLNDDTTGAIMVYLKDRKLTNQVATRLRTLIEEAGYRMMPQENQPFWAKFDSVRREDWTGQKIDVTTWEDEISFLAWTVQTFDVMSGALIFVLLVIIIIGIMNALWMAIRERTGEIGTLRAIGMPKPRVLMMFLLEAFLLSLMATVFGAGLGWGLAELINASDVPVGSEAVEAFLMRDTLYLAVDAASVVRSLIIVVGVTTVGALYPAWRAARLPPVTAIHKVG